MSERERIDFLSADDQTPKSWVESLYTACVALFSFLFIYLGAISFSPINQLSAAENASLIAAVVSSAFMLLSLTALKRLFLIGEGFLVAGMGALVFAILSSLAVNENRFSFYIATIVLATTLITGYLRFFADQPAD
jgi:hypothetical protein